MPESSAITTAKPSQVVADLHLSRLAAAAEVRPNKRIATTSTTSTTAGTKDWHDNAAYAAGLASERDSGGGGGCGSSSGGDGGAGGGGGGCTSSSPFAMLSAQRSGLESITSGGSRELPSSADGT